MISPQKEINELQSVLVLDGQAHEELGAGRRAELLLDLLARFQVPRDRGRRDGDDDISISKIRDALPSTSQPALNR